MVYWSDFTINWINNSLAGLCRINFYFYIIFKNCLAGLLETVRKAVAVEYANLIIKNHKNVKYTVKPKKYILDLYLTR